MQNAYTFSRKILSTLPFPNFFLFGQLHNGEFDICDIAHLIILTSSQVKAYFNSQNSPIMATGFIGTLITLA